MKANRLFVLAAVSFVAVVSGGSPAEADTLDTALAQKVLCTQVPGPTVLTPTDISKAAASVRTPTTTPLRAFFYGARACGQLGFQVDVHATSAVKLPAGITHFDVGATAGGRNGPPARTRRWRTSAATSRA